MGVENGGDGGFEEELEAWVENKERRICSHGGQVGVSSRAHSLPRKE